MARTILNKKDVFALLQQEVKRAGSQTAWANEHGYDRTVLNSILSGRREITAPIIELLKLKVAYVPASTQPGFEILDVDGALRMLREDVKRAGSQSAWARRHKYQRTYLSNVLARKRALTTGIIEALKLKTVYLVAT
jgi:antitoxin component HigA of HigAB toxin-antitoxin module